MNEHIVSDPGYYYQGAQGDVIKRRAISLLSTNGAQRLLWH